MFLYQPNPVLVNIFMKIFIGKEMVREIKGEEGKEKEGEKEV